MYGGNYHASGYYGDLSFAYRDDIRIQRGRVAFGASTDSFVEDIAPVVLANAFVRITNVEYGAGGKHDGTTGNGNNDDIGVVCYLSSTSQITFSRQSTGNNADYRIEYEVWEYIGNEHGDNEFKVRYSTPVNVTTTDKHQSVTNIIDIDKCVPFICGITHISSNPRWNQALVTAEMEQSGGSDYVYLKRGLSDGTARVAIAVVEFTGKNWTIENNIEHQFSAAGANETEAITAVTVAESFVISSQRITGATEYGLDEIGWNCWFKDTNELYFRLRAGATAPTGHYAMAHVISNSFLAVEHIDSITGSGTDHGAPITKLQTIEEVARLDMTGLFATHDCAGTDTAYPRPFWNYFLSDYDEVTFWRAYGGQPGEWALQVIDFASIRSLENKTILDTLSDSLGLSESFAIQKTLYRTLTDTLPLGEVFVASLQRLFSDIFSLSDTISKNPQRKVSDTISFSDSITSNLLQSKYFTDIIAFLDTHTASSERLLTDTLPLSDTISKNSQRELSDTISFSDSIVTNLSKHLADTIGLLDTYVITPSKFLIDTLGLLDIFNRNWTLSRDYSDSIGLNDSINTSISRSFIDSLPFSDTFSQFLTIAKSWSDSIGLTDTISKHSQKEFQDSFPLSDSINVGMQASLSDNIELVENISKSTQRELSDSLPLTDSMNIGFRFSRTYTDLITLSDINDIPYLSYYGGGYYGLFYYGGGSADIINTGRFKTEIGKWKLFTDTITFVEKFYKQVYSRFIDVVGPVITSFTDAVKDTVAAFADDSGLSSTEFSDTVGIDTPAWADETHDATSWEDETNLT